MRWLIYSNDPKYKDRQVRANSVDPAQTASDLLFPDQDVHCLPLLDRFLFGKTTVQILRYLQHFFFSGV